MDYTPGLTVLITIDGVHVGVSDKYRNRKEGANTLIWFVNTEVWTWESIVSHKISIL